MIQNKTQPDDWRWIPTDQNPADLGSRGVTLTYLNNSSLWLKGPEFLVDKYYDFDKYKKENLVLQMTDWETDRKERKIVVGTFSQSTTGLFAYLPTFHYLHMTTLVFSSSTMGNDHPNQHSHYVKFTDTTNDSHDPSELVEKGKQKHAPSIPTKINKEMKRFFFQKGVKPPEGQPDPRGVLRRLPKWDRTVRMLCYVKRWVNRGHDFVTEREESESKPIQHGYSLRRRNTQESKDAGNDQSKDLRSKKKKNVPPPSIKEIVETELLLFRVAQFDGFYNEIRQFKTGGCVGRSSPLYPCYPLWDPEDLLI